MTTIAYREGVMAGDTLVTAGNSKCPGWQKKVWRLKYGTLVGICGSVPEAQAFIYWAQEDPGMETQCPPFRESEALIVRLDGVTLHCEGGSFRVVGDAEFLAIGSGRDVALGCMWMGGTARDAVRAAMAFDMQTGGSVQTVSIRQKRKRK